MDTYAMAPGTNLALIGAVDWLRSVLLGPVGTTVAVLAVGGVGALMFNGYLPIRRGASVILGCFILFSATAIADGLVGGVRGPDIVPSPAPVAPPVTYTLAVPKPVPYDPYAGASVPVQQPGAPIIR